MKNKKLYFLFLFLSILFAGCNGEAEIEKWPEIGNYYDSSKPIAFEAMAPDWGRINDSFIIKGNFPVDTTGKVKVFFADKEAVIVNNNGNELYGLIPTARQPVLSLNRPWTRDAVMWLLCWWQTVR